jgi:hypothetical protein
MGLMGPPTRKSDPNPASGSGGSRCNQSETGCPSVFSHISTSNRWKLASGYGVIVTVTPLLETKKCAADIEPLIRRAAHLMMIKLNVLQYHVQPMTGRISLDDSGLQTHLQNSKAVITYGYPYSSCPDPGAFGRQEQPAEAGVSGWGSSVRYSYCCRS